MCVSGHGGPHRLSDDREMVRPRVSGINHVTLTAASIGDAVAFYCETLGCELIAYWPAGAYLTAGTTWIALVASDEPPSPATDYTHLALDVSPGDFDGLAERIRGSGTRVWQDNWTEGDSLYFEDPTGHRLEIHCSNLAGRLAAARSDPWKGLVIL
jgi:catechol 2,3-dioxygenase-like lactoylglutathione lyase family enzyme